MKSNSFIIFLFNLMFVFGSFASDYKLENSEKVIKKLNKQVTQLRKKYVENDRQISWTPNHKDYLQSRELALLDEYEFGQIEKEVIIPWEDSWKEKKHEALLKKVGKQVITFSWNNFQKSAELNAGIIEKYVWSNNSLLEGKKSAKSDLRSYLSQFKKIEDVAIDVFQIKSLMSSRNLNDLSMNSVECLAYFDLRGVDSFDFKRNDRATLKIKLNKENSKWMVQEIGMLSGDSVRSKSQSFQKITEEAGLSKANRYPRTEAIRRGGYAISLADINNDDNLDIFVGAMKESELFIGNNLSFEKANIPLISNTLVKTAIFSDFTNSSKQDLLLVRFDSQGENKNRDLLIYKNDGKGNFSGPVLIENREKTDYAMPASVADFNNDGLLDFYAGFPGAKDFTFHESLVSSHYNRLAQGVFLNIGDFKFLDSTKNSLNNLPDFQKIFPHSSLAADYDLDGDMDLIVIDDRGNLSPVYTNNGKGVFSSSAPKIGMSNDQYGMGAAMGDLNNDGYMDFILTNVNFLAAKRINSSIEINWDAKYSNKGADGLRLFWGSKNGVFIEDKKTLSWEGEGLAGVEIIDYNNDGFLDIYVANGLWSGSNRRENDLSRLFISSLDRGIDFDESLQNSFAPEKDSASVFMKLLTNFRGSLRKEKFEKSGNLLSMAGHQRNRLYLNNGNSTFTEVGYLEGVDEIADGYVIATGDLNKDGKTDLVLRNGDPGSLDVAYNSVDVYLNKSTLAHNSIQLKLVGNKSNRDAVGSIIEVKSGGTVQIRNLIANNGTSQSERIVHFGIGDKKVAEEIKISWPSGETTLLKNVAPGRYNINESQTKAIALVKSN